MTIKTYHIPEGAVARLTNTGGKEEVIECGVVIAEEPVDSVGWLIFDCGKLRVICDKCYGELEDTKGVRIFQINIYPYNQLCYGCDAQLIVGQSPTWPQLFDGR